MGKTIPSPVNSVFVDAKLPSTGQSWHHLCRNHFYSILHCAYVRASVWVRLMRVLSLEVFQAFNGNNSNNNNTTIAGIQHRTNREENLFVIRSHVTRYGLHPHHTHTHTHKTFSGEEWNETICKIKTRRIEILHVRFSITFNACVCVVLDRWQSAYMIRMWVCVEAKLVSYANGENMLEPKTRVDCT